MIRANINVHNQIRLLQEIVQALSDGGIPWGKGISRASFTSRACLSSLYGQKINDFLRIKTEEPILFFTLPTFRPISNARYVIAVNKLFSLAGIYSSAGKIPCVGLLSRGANSVAALL